MRRTLRGKWIIALGVVGVLALVLAPPSTVSGQQIHRYGFESHDAVWVRGPADVTFKETAHQLTDTAAHGGRYSEQIQIQAEQGTHIHYTYDLGKAPLNEELNISVWVKANRPGVQILARLVLPHMRQEGRVDEPLTTILRGDLYQQAGRFQRLELRRPVKLAKEQQQLLRAELNKDVNLADAYVDQVILNVYGGLGLNEVWIDDLEAGPLLGNAPFRTTTRPTVTPDTASTLPVPRRGSVVALQRDRLSVGGKRYFFRAIRHTDTPLKVLWESGFNTVWLGDATPERVREAVDLGFWVVPRISVVEGQNQLRRPDAIQQDITRLAQLEGILFWDLGSGGLATEQAGLVGQAAQLVHSTDPQHPLAADIWDGFRPYSRSVELLGVHRWPLHTSLEMSQYRDWLNQRRLLANPDAFLWTWVQTHLTDSYSQMVYGHDAGVGYEEPVGPQPEQVRLMTYLALSAGCRGLGFWSDRFLADSHQGRDRLLGVALLNLELQMLEELLVSTDSVVWIDTSIPQVKAAVFHTDRGVLILPIWLGSGSQYVPGQAAAAELSMVVPDVPISASGWEVSPADVRALRSERVAGGRRVTLREFGLTAAVVFTSDNGASGLLVRLQEQVRRMRRAAAQWSYAQTEVELDKVQRVQAQLEKGGHAVPDATNLLNNSRERLQRAAMLWDEGNYRESYLEARRAARPLRILMRAQWEQAITRLDAPVASPYAVSYYTLPRHHAFMDREVTSAVAGMSLLAGGDFERDGATVPDGWQPQAVTLDPVQLAVRQVAEEHAQGKQSLMLQITPQDANHAPRALERTFLAVHSPTVRAEPGSLVRVSGSIMVPAALGATADGALLYDSAGGEPLAIRVSGPMRWKSFSLYRRVPPSGAMSVTLALTGLGTVYFDDIRIEPMTPAPPQAPPPPAPGQG